LVERASSCKRLKEMAWHSYMQAVQFAKVLPPGEMLRVDTGCLVAMTQDVEYDIEFVKGKTAVIGGEGLFFATLRGPGKVWIQSLPISRLADRIISASRMGGRKEEGSILGGLGNLLDGDGRQYAAVRKKGQTE
jgi:hypothetical protein